MSASFGLSQLSFRIPILSDIFDFLKNLPNIIMSALNYILSSLLYGIQMGFFFLIDMIQAVFRKIAGLDVYWYRESSNTYTNVEGDIVETFIKSDTVWNIFIAVCVAAIILLFVTTIIAILKTELNEKDNSKTPVIKNALKAVAYFVIVPVVCVFGIALANIFLRSFDSATAYKGATSISGQVFASASFNANRVRSEHLAGDSDLSDIKERLKPLNTDPKIRDSSSRAEIADALDYAFVHDLSCKDVEYYFGDMDDYMAGYAYILGGKKHYHKTSFDKYTMELVYYYYDMMNYNYLIGYFASYTIIMLLLNLMIGVIQRIFDLTILFIVSPAFIATMPLDEGQRFKKWKDTFISKTLGLYGPIIGINLAFTILTLVQRIYIFDPSGGGLNGLFNSLMQCIFVIVAILCVKDFGKLLNTIIGGDDITNNKAAEVSKVLQKGAAVGARVGVGAAKLGVAGAKATVQGARAFGRATRDGLGSMRRNHNLRGEQRRIDRENAQLNQLENELNQDVDNEVANMTQADRKRIFDERFNALSEDEQLAWGDRSAEENDRIAEGWYREAAGRKYQSQFDDINRARAENQANSAGLDQQRQYERDFRRQIRRDFLNNGVADPLITMGRGGLNAGQDFYKAGKLGYNNSALYEATKTWRDMEGTQSMEDAGVTIAQGVLAGSGFQTEIRDKNGNVTGWRRVTENDDTVKDAIKTARGKIKASATSKKNKDENDKEKDNKALADAIAKAIVNQLRSGGGTGGGTP